MNRREFLKTAAALAAAGVVPGVYASPATQPATSILTRRRGFNLLNLFDPNHIHDFAEEDFSLIAEWGFDFVRLPASYLCWSKSTDWLTMREDGVSRLDHAVHFGQQHGVHVCLNLHRIPGYCVNPPKEPSSLWTDSAALDAAVHQWSTLAARFKDIPSTALSFDLINEPGDLHADVYVKVIKALVQGIREKDPNRLIIADGLKWGTRPVKEVINLDIAQSTRGYAPMQVSHFRAPWVKGSQNWATPTWPIQVKDVLWDKAHLRAEQADWLALQSQGVAVHVGEWGAYNSTPHDVVLAWMHDNLELWKQNGWGWSLWNLYGSFGVIDSERKDVEYETFRGRKLDRAMLDLLRSF